MHWSAPKSLVLVLNKELKFESSFSNKKKTFVGRLFQRFTKPKNNVVIPYQFIDRPTKDFADLLLSYMYTGKLEGIMTE